MEKVSSKELTLSEKKHQITEMLKSGLVTAVGCTEPACVAYAAAYAVNLLQEKPEQIILNLSANLLKNGMNVGIPASKYKGVKFAAALGALFGKPDDKLDILAKINPSEQEKAYAWVQSGAVILNKADTKDKLYAEVIAKGNNNTAKVIIKDNHLNIVFTEFNNVIKINKLTDTYSNDGEYDNFDVSIADIYDYIETEDNYFDSIEASLKYNLNIADEGMVGDYGLQAGKKLCRQEDDLSVWEKASVQTAAGIDARMAGSVLKVMANSGSGNQGITATVAVAIIAKECGADRKTIIKAVALSNLAAIYLKRNFYPLSHLCGAVTASAGAAAGMSYLMGGKAPEIERAMQNVLAAITGILCDGAKSTCALKVASGIMCASLAAKLALFQTSPCAAEGMVGASLKQTIANIAEFEQKTSQLTDNTILEIMLKNENTGV